MMHYDVVTLVWPNGADFAPEFLHDNLQRRASVNPQILKSLNPQILKFF